MKRRIAVLLTIALLLSLSACGDDPGVGDPPLLFTKPTAEEDPTEPSNIVPTQVPTVAPTVIPTATPTAAPTQEPTAAPTEAPKPPKYSGWEILSPGMEFTRNADGIIVLAGAYYNHWVNGFLIADTGVDFLSFHSGEPVWLTGKQEKITIHHEASTYSVEFVWCSHMGEVGTNSVGASVSPIPGNDRYVSVRIPETKYWYLLDLKTLVLMDVLSKIEPQYRECSSLSLAPSADKAILTVGNTKAIWDFTAGTTTPIHELTGVEGADLCVWASGTPLVLVTTRYIGPEVTYADAVLYDLTDGSIKELYKNARYGWFRDMGGLEHKGRMYCYYDPQTMETVFVDALTGTEGRISHFYPYARQMGGNNILYEDAGMLYILKPDGSATPLFTTKADQ
ncbi:MAG: hypothetical protein IKM59_06415 [Oscillospiraceae bacterium]|nr:hypothetical protein [Oscillospiraceae bacterium]